MCTSVEICRKNWSKDDSLCSKIFYGKFMLVAKVRCDSQIDFSHGHQPEAGREIHIDRMRDEEDP